MATMNKMKINKMIFTHIFLNYRLVWEWENSPCC